MGPVSAGPVSWRLDIHKCSYFVPIHHRRPVIVEITYFVVVPFQETENGLVADQGIQCPSERSAIAQARGAVSKGAIGAIAFRRSGDPNIGEYGEAVLICKEGDLPDGVMEMLAA